MLNMPVRVAQFAAMWVMIAVVSSAVLTCIPGAMSVQAMHMPACAGMHEQGSAISADLPADCCVRHELSLTAAKIDLRQVPLERLACAAWVVPTFAPTALARRAETSPGLTSTLGPPVYITLSALRI
jgi:hypothetical protein